MTKQNGRYIEGATEVSVCLLRSETDPSQWKVVVPLQEVTAVTVDARTEYSCDLFTGEEYTVFPPEGWLHAGSLHSHQQMDAFWSSRDDQGELEVPGMHCTVGSITDHSFSICSSIVLNKNRYIYDPRHLLEIPPNSVAPSPTSPKSIYSATRTKGITINFSEKVEISDVCHNYVNLPKVSATYSHYRKPNVKIGLANTSYEYDDWYYGSSYSGLGGAFGDVGWYNSFEEKEELEKQVKPWLEKVGNLVEPEYPVNVSIKEALVELNEALEKLCLVEGGHQLIAACIGKHLDFPTNLEEAEKIVEYLLD
jgi:hypothetical protein